MASTYIIDGYNLIRRLGGTGGLSLEAQRDALEARLRAFRLASGPGTRILLVYDGGRGRVAPARHEKGFEIYFSKPPRQADDIVLDLARKHEGGPGVHVVTSDMMDIGGRVQGLRVRHLKAEEFAGVLAGKLDKPGRRSTMDSAAEPEEECKPDSLSRDEVARWVREFGFGDPEEGGAP